MSPSKTKINSKNATITTKFFGSGIIFTVIAIVSAIINLLTLTAPLFMLQIYDLVLASRSVATLLLLAIRAAGLYAFQAALDILRSRVLLRIGEQFDNQLSGRVHECVIRLSLYKKLTHDGLQPLRDLDNVRSFLSSPGVTAFFDFPWMVFYLGICFAFHFWLGMTALVGALVIVALTFLINILSQRPIRSAVEHNQLRMARLEAKPPQC